ncbi:MAG: hypothetical protein FVQ85_21820 [Planctomycetes bacterium]|nr:hypothetical protein [Planctomycetota bacterium]
MVKQVVEEYPKPLNVDFNDLFFHEFNPRLSMREDHLSEKDVIRWMVIHGNILPLMESIGMHGYSPAEPLLVVKKQGSENQFVVVEGNRRLAAVKLLNNPALSGSESKAKSLVNTVSGVSEDQIPKELPVLEYKQKEDILPYLGFRHMTGVRPWGAMEKARYLRQLFDLYEDNYATQVELFEFLQRATSMGPRRARKDLTSLAIYDRANKNKYWGIKGIKSVEFSLIQTALNYKNIVNYFNLRASTAYDLDNLNEQHTKDFFEWCFAHVPDDKSPTRLGESRNLRDLSKIVANAEALNQFKKGLPVLEAAEFAEDPISYLAELILSAQRYVNDSISALRNLDTVENRHSGIIDDLLNKVDELKSVYESKAKP